MTFATIREASEALQKAARALEEAAPEDAIRLEREYNKIHEAFKLLVAKLY